MTPNNLPRLSCIEINSKEPPSASLIWMHGLGATADDFVPVAKELQRLTGQPLRFIFPQAPSRPVTINNGYIMPAWYDIVSFERGEKIDIEGIHTSVAQINTLIDEEKRRGRAAQQILVAGFSQGAVIALATLSHSAERLGGAIALSGYVPFKVPESVFHSSVFWGHGMLDDIVPFELGQIGQTRLTEAGFKVTPHEYAMPHSVCPEEIRDIAKWIKTVL